jgi:hypothetical protein
VTTDGVYVGTWIDRTNTQLATTSNNSSSWMYAAYIPLWHELSYLSQLCLHQSSGNCFQQQIFLFLWVLKLPQLVNECKKKTKTKTKGHGVHERTIPTERPPLVGEVIANFCG